jgi:hypothetical protein
MQAFAAQLVVSSVVAWLLSLCIRSQSISPFWMRTILGHAWWLLTIIALAIGARTLQFEEKWQQAIYWLWLLIVTLCVSGMQSNPRMIWILAFVAVAIFLGVSLPGGDGWQDMAITKYVGWLVGGIAWLVNVSWFSEQRLGACSKVSLVWTVFASQAALSINALSYYGSLGAWALSLSAIAIAFTTLVSNAEITILRAVLWPVFAAGSLVAITSVLYGAKPLPVLLALFLPTLVGLGDCICQRRSFRSAQRSWSVLIVSTVLLATSVALAAG